MRVVAIAVGFHDGQRRRPGAEFDVAEGSKASWYVPAAEAPEAAPAEKQEPVALSQLGKGKDAAVDFVTAHRGKQVAQKKATPTPADLA